jgi:hypothetical protein
MNRFLGVLALLVVAGLASPVLTGLGIAALIRALGRVRKGAKPGNGQARSMGCGAKDLK